MGKYVVKAKNLTLLKKSSIVEKNKELWNNTPDAWKQGEWTNVVLNQNEEIDSEDFEDASLRQAFVNKLVGLGVEETEPVPVAKSNKGNRKELLAKEKAKAKAKESEEEEPKKTKKEDK